MLVELRQSELWFLDLKVPGVVVEADDGPLAGF